MTRSERRRQAAINAQRHRAQRASVAASVAAEVEVWNAQPHDYSELQASDISEVEAFAHLMEDGEDDG